MFIVVGMYCIYLYLASQDSLLVMQDILNIFSNFKFSTKGGVYKIIVLYYNSFPQFFEVDAYVYLSDETKIKFKLTYLITK